MLYQYSPGRASASRRVCTSLVAILCVLSAAAAWAQQQTPSKGSSEAVDEIRIDEKGIRVRAESSKPESVVGKPPHPPDVDTIGESEAATTRGDIVKFGESIVVTAGVLIEGDVVSIGGSVDVHGEVEGDVVAVGGNVHIYPSGVVTGDAAAVGGSVVKDAGARVEGQTLSFGVGGLGNQPWILPMILPLTYWDAQFSRFAGFLVKVTWVGILILLAVLVAALLPRPTETVARTIEQRPWRAGLIGLLGELLIGPLLVLMVISILGIPLVPVVLILIVAAFFLGFVGLSLWLGQAFKLGSFQARTPVVAVIVGGILINLLWLLGSLIRIGGRIFDGIGGLVFAIGFLLAYVVWTIGFGGALASRFGSRLPAPNGLTAPATVQTAPPPPAPPGSQIQPPVST